MLPPCTVAHVLTREERQENVIEYLAKVFKNVARNLNWSDFNLLKL